MKAQLDKELDKAYEEFSRGHEQLRDNFMSSLAKFSEEPKQPNGFGYVWSLIGSTFLRSRIAKLAATAVIIIVVLIGISEFADSIFLVSTAFGQVLENMKGMPWMHVVVEGAGERLETWICFEQRVIVSKRGSGEIRFRDDLKQTFQVFNPDTNTITISYSAADTFAGFGHSALDFPKNLLKLFEEAGEKVIQEAVKYKGQDSKIYKMSGFLGGMDMTAEMVVDMDKDIILFLNQKVFDKDGKLKIEANAYFDYPENGPNSIYEVGVPTLAKVEISEKEKMEYDKAFGEAIAVIDNLDNWPEPCDLVVAYWKAWAEKNYDEVSMFRPGSAIWNREVLENEEPIEYVFGKVLSAESDGHIIVSYATKSYYEKHGKYSLKMRLENKKSSKGRYYIVSGN